MKSLDFISVRLCLCLAIGICLGWTLQPQPGLVLLILGVGLSGLLLFFLFEDYRRGVFFGCFVLLAVIGLGMLAIRLSDPKIHPDHYSHIRPEGDGLWMIRVKEKLKSSAYAHSYLLEVEALNGVESRGVILGKQRISGVPPLSVNDRILVKGAVKPILPPANPHQFNYKEYMEVLGVYHMLNLGTDNHAKLPPGTAGIWGKAGEFREYVQHALNTSSLGKDAGGMIQALLLGQRNDLDPEVYQDYRDAGAAHILAVSGLHIGILLMLIRILLKPLHLFRNGKWISLILSLMLLWGYALITGLSPSVVRAVTMFSFIAYALSIDRPGNTINILALSMFGMLLVEPRFLFQVGFQLSYAAVFAIAWGYPILLRTWRPRSAYLKKFWKLLAVSLAAQMGVMPLCLFYFHQFPGLFLLSALVLIPFLGLLLGAGILVVFLACLKMLPDILAQTYGSLIGAMNAVVHVIAAREEFVFRDIPMDGIGLVLLFLFLGFLVRSIQEPRYRNLIFVGLSIIALQFHTLFRIHQNSDIQEVYLLHIIGISGMLSQDGRELKVLSTGYDRIAPLAKNLMVSRYLHPPSYAGMPGVFTINKERWIVVDSTGILPPVTAPVKGLILTQSPRVHLGRLLNTVHPKIVIADGSNYSRDVALWRKTCASYDLPFYSTAEHGALLLNKM